MTLPSKIFVHTCLQDDRAIILNLIPHHKFCTYVFYLNSSFSTRDLLVSKYKGGSPQRIMTRLGMSTCSTEHFSVFTVMVLQPVSLYRYWLTLTALINTVFCRAGEVFCETALVIPLVVQNQTV